MCVWPFTLCYVVLIIKHGVERIRGFDKGACTLCVHSSVLMLIRVTALTWNVFLSSTGAIRDIYSLLSTAIDLFARFFFRKLLSFDLVQWLF